MTNKNMVVKKKNKVSAQQRQYILVYSI